MNYDCKVEFNIPTDLRDDAGFSQRMKENEEAYKYVTDFRPMTMCMMDHVPLQGQQVGTRGPPPQVLDIEWALRKDAMEQKTNEYISKDPTAAPSTPAVFQRKLFIPHCNDIFKPQKTRTRKSERPPQQSSTPKATSRLNTNYMRPGIDTRRELKDNYKRWEENKAKTTNIYGLAKYDSRPLVAGTTLNCHAGDSNLNCMYVYGPDGVPNGQVPDNQTELPAVFEQTNEAVPFPNGKDEGGSWMEVYKQPLLQPRA